MTRKPSSQPSISRFFSSQPYQEKKVVVDLSDDDEVPQEVKRNSLANFKFNRSGNTSTRTLEQQLIHESFLNKLLSKGEKRTIVKEEVSSRAKKLKSHFDQLTPLEQQFVTLKRNNLDKVLAIQVGYKIKFFGEDAAKVHKILSIMLIPGKISLDLDNPQDLGYEKFAYCSIPDNRLHIHLKRLLDRGLKVGVVEQVEVAAIKNLSSNKNSLFDRRITKVYTSGTYIDDDNFDSIFNKSGNFIIGLKEIDHIISMLAVQLVSGEIVYDSFQDDFSRNEFETRLLHLDPTEFLIIDDISKETASCLEDFKKFRKSNLRITYSKSLSYQIYINELSSFFDDIDFVMALDKDVQIICFEMVNYLKEFELETIFNKTENFQSFNDKNYMILNNQTLRNLEIFQNSTNGEEKGSLLWLLDHTRTKFGFRLLKKWILKPLITREDIMERQNIVDCLIKSYDHRVIEMFLNFLNHSQDLEKSLNRIHFQKCSMKEIYLILQKLNELLGIIESFKIEELSEFHESLKEVFVVFKTSADQLMDFKSYLGMINSHIIKDDHMELRQQKLQYFNSRFFNFEELQEQKNYIQKIKEQLDEELLRIRSLLKRPQLQYTSNNKENYLIEVRNADVAKLPKNWLKFNSTKAVSRFFTPEVSKLLDEFKYHEEVLLKKTDENFKKFLAKIDSHYSQLNKIIKQLAQLDCLLSLSAASVGLTKPKLIDKPYIELIEAKNPILEMLNPHQATISNDIKMSEEEDRVLVITGPNMGGKSSLIKQIAITVIMAQIGCFLPLRYACIGIFTKIFIRMGSSDNILQGESTFQLEMMECLNILKQKDDKSLILLDEIGRGTSTNDGFAIAFSILSYLITETKSFVLFITHFNKLINFEKNFSNVKNFHMNYLINGNELTFLYKFIRGGCSKSYGINVARLTSIPIEIIENAQRISKEYEESLGLKMNLNWSFKARDLLREINMKDSQKIREILDDLIDNI